MNTCTIPSCWLYVQFLENFRFSHVLNRLQPQNPFHNISYYNDMQPNHKTYCTLFCTHVYLHVYRFIVDQPSQAHSPLQFFYVHTSCTHHHALATFALNLHCGRFADDIMKWGWGWHCHSTHSICGLFLLAYSLVT